MSSPLNPASVVANIDEPVVPGSALREARKNAKLKQEEAAEMSGVTRQTIWRWEVGEKDEPPEGLRDSQVRYLRDLMKAAPENRALLLNAAGVSTPDESVLDIPHFGRLVERLAAAYEGEHWNELYTVIDATLRGMVEKSKPPGHNQGEEPPPSPGSAKARA